MKQQPIEPQFTTLFQSTGVLEVEGTKGRNHLEREHESKVLMTVTGDVGDAVYHHLDGIVSM